MAVCPPEQRPCIPERYYPHARIRVFHHSGPEIPGSAREGKTAFILSRKPSSASRVCWVHNRVWLTVVDGDESELRAGLVRGAALALGMEFRCGEPHRWPAIGHGQSR